MVIPVIATLSSEAVIQHLNVWWSNPALPVKGGVKAPLSFIGTQAYFGGRPTFLGLILWFVSRCFWAISASWDTGDPHRVQVNKLKASGPSFLKVLLIPGSPG